MSKNNQTLSLSSLLLLVVVTCILTMVVILYFYEWYKKHHSYEIKEQIIEATIFEERIREAFTSLASTKVYVAEYLAAKGALATRISQLGITSDEFIRSSWIKSIDILDNGALTATISTQQKDKEEVVIVLTPIVKDSTQIMRWDCTTPNYEKIREIIPVCIFTPAH